MKMIIEKNIRGIRLILLTIFLVLVIAPFTTEEAHAADEMVAMFDFAGNFSDGVGNSTLSISGYAPECSRTFYNDGGNAFGNASGSTIADKTYWWWKTNTSPGGGFYIDIPRNISSSYTIALRFSYNDIDSSSWDKIIDYNNMKDDAGFYYKAQNLQFYPRVIGSKKMSANTIYDLVVTRNGNTNEFSAYIVSNRNASKEVSFSDASNEAKPYTTANGHTILHFFHDDGGSEYTSGGQVYAIKIYNYAMTEAQAAAALEGFSVAYNGNGATSGVPTDATLYTPQNNTVRISSSVPVRMGYTFTGWKNSVNNTVYSAGSSFTANSNVTLTAQWTPISYYINYNLNGGTLVTEYNNTNYNNIFYVRTPQKTGYTFTGWTVTSGLNTSTAYWGTTTSVGTRLTSSSTLCKNNSAGLIYFKNLNTNNGGTVMLTANWTPITYIIQHSIKKPSDATGTPTGQPQNITATYDSAYTLRPAPSLTGYTFGGWYRDSNCTNLLGNAGATVNQNLSNTQSSLITIYAKWTANTYTVNFNQQSGSGGSVSTMATYDSAMPGITKPTRTGYTFGGYYTGTNGTGTQYYNANGASARNWTTASTDTLYAKWTANTYSVVYDKNKPSGATGSVSGSMANSSHTYDTAKNLTANGYTLSGYSFKGWTTTNVGGVSYANGASVENLTAVAGGSVTLYAVWEQNEYDIIFNAQGGSGGTTKAVTFDEALPDSVNTAKNGYVFGGWYTGIGGTGTQYYNTAGEKQLAKYTVAGNTTIYAKWDPKTYTIMYYDGESYVGEQNATYGSYELKSASHFDLTRLYFTFMGWNSYDNQDWAMYQPDREYSGGLISSDADSAIVYAAWKGVEEYTVTYSANGGAAAPASAKVYADTPNYTISSTIPTRNGYTFKGWSTDSATTLASYQPSGQITVGDDTILYAVWAEEYTVSYYANGGTGSVPANAGYTKDTTVNVNFGTLPTRAGYTFTGWATDPNTEAEYTSDGTTSFTMGEADVELYAVWTANDYTVEFNANSGTGSMSSQNFTYDVAQTLSRNSFTQIGKNFAGWATSAGGSVAYTDLQSVKNLTTEAGGSVALYAVWSDGQTYYITYDLNGGSGTTPTSQTGSVTINDGTGLTRTGYTFENWNTKADGTGTDRAASDSVTVSSSITLYAQWAPITYRVVFHENADDTEGTSQSFTYDAEQPLRANSYESSGGYTFLGWATTVSGQKTYNDEQVVKNLTSVAGYKIDLYPVWQATVTTVLLNANGGSGGSSGTNVVYGSAFDGTGLIPPVRYGYVFEGYFLDEDGDSIKDEGETMWFASNMTPISTVWNYNETTKTLHAWWSPVSYTIKFVNGITELPTVQNAVYGEAFTLKTAAELGINNELTTQHLAGWTTTPASNTVWYTDGQTIATGLTGTPNATVHLYAVFADNDSYVLNYDANGGTGAPVPQSQQTQTGSPTLDFTISGNVPTRDNYVFLGWATNSGATEAQYTSGASISIGSNTTLYAVWRSLSGYAVIYDKNTTDTVTGLPDRGIKTEGVNYTVSSTIPGRTGYDFLGWGTESDGTGTPYASGSTYSVDEEITLYAIWQIKSFSVTLPSSGDGYAVAAVSSSPVDYGQNFEFTVTLNEGKDAATMVVSANGNTLSGSVNGRIHSYTIRNITTAQEVIVSGVNASTYTVTFRMNDGTDAVYLTRSVTHNSAVDRPSDPVRVGYEFAGWYSGDTLYNFASAVVGNTNLTAKWNRIATYTVSFDANGGGAAPVAQQKASGVDLTLSAVSPLRTGWNFVGWGTTREALTPDYYSGGTYSDDADITLYAIWSQDSFAIILPTGSGYSAEAVLGYSSPVSYSGTYRFTVTLENGYSKDAMVVAANGVTLAPIEGTNTYVLENIRAAQQITVLGVEKQSFAVSLPVGTGYTAESDETRVEYGDDYTFTVTLDDAYSSSTPNAKNNGTVLTGTNEGLEYTYTIENVTEVPKITITNVTANPVYTVTYLVDGALYTTQSVEDGQKATQPYSPVKAGYSFKEWQNNETAWNFNEDVVSMTMEFNVAWTLNSPNIITPADYADEYDGEDHTLVVAPTHQTYGVTFAYQWYKGSVSNGNEVGTDSTSFTIRNVDDSDNYFCAVTVSDGTLTSEAAETNEINVSITPATPGISLANKSVSVGSETSIGPAVVTGISGEIPIGTVTYSYYSDAACTQVLSEQPSAAGTYYAKASIAPDGNYASATSDAARLTISPAGSAGAGGGGGGGGGEVVPAAVTIPVVAGDGAVAQNSYILEGTDAKLDYDANVLNEVVSAAKTSGTVTIDASGVSEVQSVSLPAGLVSTISDSDTVQDLTVKTPSAGITLDAHALKTINNSFDSSYDAVTVKATPLAPEQLTEAQQEIVKDNHNAVIIDLSATLTHYNAGGSITGSKNIHELGGSATISFAYQLKEGQNPDALKVYYISENGQTESLDAVYNNGIVTVSTTHFSTYVVEYCPMTLFTDCELSKWYHEDIDYVVSAGLMQGTSATTFDPNSTTTRDMIVTMLYRLDGNPVVTGACPFEDVPSGAYYEKAVIWASENNIAGGYGDNKFGPKDSITREQMATTLWRYAKYKGYDVSVGEDTNILSYNDAFDIADYAIPALQWACGAGLIKGDEGYLMPQGDAQRCQVAAILHRFCENVK